MAIWIWIIAAWVLSFLALGKQKVSFQHLIWILLPVDMYGITVAGAMIKPYMIFCMFLLVRILLQRNFTLNITKWLAAAAVISGAVVLINFVNNTSNSAPKAALLLIIVCGCCAIYLNNCGKETWQDVPNVLVATGIGYGIIFIIGYIVMNSGLDLPGVLADNRYSDGFFMTSTNVRNGALVYANRLRGFTIDPNTMIGTFAFCATCCIIRILNGNVKMREWIGLIISGVCVLMSNSRMGIICFVILSVLTSVISYRIAKTKVRNIIKLAVPFLIGITIIILIGTDFIQNIWLDIVEMYSYRSGLNDKHGRFTIWKEAISVLFQQNPFLGIGMGQMRNYTDIGKDCHNTWLSMICYNGIIIGGILVLLFLYAAYMGISKMKNNSDTLKRELCGTIVIGTIIVMASLISVDHITYSYLWFGASLISAITINNPR